MYNHGWYQVAFENELTTDLTPALIGTQRLVLARMGDGFRAFSADCPHRGAHLAYGGRLERNGIVCPFHGYRVGLGACGQHDFTVPEYQTLVLGGLVFVQLGDEYDFGFTSFMQGLAEDHVFVPGFALPVKVAAHLVIENAFDHRHFPAVHRINTGAFAVDTAPDGHVLVSSEFSFPARHGFRSESGEVVDRLKFTGNAFSPGLIVTEMGGDSPYFVITASTPQPDGTTVIRLSLALLRERYGDPPDRFFCDVLLGGSRQGLADDQLMWENLSPTAPQRLLAQDTAVRTFQTFCAQFALSREHAYALA